MAVVLTLCATFGLERFGLNDFRPDAQSGHDIANLLPWTMSTFWPMELQIHFVGDGSDCDSRIAFVSMRRSSRADQGKK